MRRDSEALIIVASIVMITIAISLDASVSDSRIQKSKLVWIIIISFNEFVIAKSILSTIFATFLSKLKRYVDLFLSSSLAKNAMKNSRKQSRRELDLKKLYFLFEEST